MEATEWAVPKSGVDTGTLLPQDGGTPLLQLAGTV